MLIRFGDSPNLSQFGLLCNTGDAGLFSNVRHAMTLGLPEVEIYKATGQPAVICGGGPSLGSTLESIREKRDDGARIFALNNAAQYLVAHGIKPDVQILVDPRPQNVAFLEKPWAGEVLLSSQCHPSLFTQCREIGYPVRLWHPAIGGIEDVVTTGKQIFVGGGMTVGLSGLCLVYTLGHRDIHLFGYDSSHSGESSHAFAQPMNAGDEMVRCVADNKVFLASMAMAAQANDFRNVSDMLLEHGCAINVYGEGLLPTMWRMWEREAKERVLNAVYDLGLCSVDPREFRDFLESAEYARKDGKYDWIDVTVEPGPLNGFRDDRAPQDLDALNESLWQECIPLARRTLSVRNITVLRRRRAIDGDVFPNGYAENSPKSHYPAQLPMEKTS